MEDRVINVERKNVGNALLLLWNVLILNYEFRLTEANGLNVYETGEALLMQIIIIINI